MKKLAALILMTVLAFSPAAQASAAPVVAAATASQGLMAPCAPSEGGNEWG